MGKVVKFRKSRRLTPEIVNDLLRIHSSCVHDQEGRCGLQISVSSLCWELNQAANIGDETDNAFRRCSEMTAARPLSDHDVERIIEGVRITDSMNEEEPE